jgi:hypothetical protein
MRPSSQRRGAPSSGLTLGLSGPPRACPASDERWPDRTSFYATSGSIAGPPRAREPCFGSGYAWWQQRGNIHQVSNRPPPDTTNTPAARLRALWGVSPVGVRVSLGALRHRSRLVGPGGSDRTEKLARWLEKNSRPASGFCTVAPARLCDRVDGRGKGNWAGAASSSGSRGRPLAGTRHGAEGRGGVGPCRYRKQMVE